MYGMIRLPCASCGRSWDNAVGKCKDKDHIAYREKRKEYTRLYQAKLGIKAIMILGGKCERCGETDVRVLQINHRNGGGVKDFKKKGPQTIYIEIIKGKRGKDEFDVRCSNCNILYEYEMGRRRDYTKSL